jgi:hypothetical protein
VTPSHLGSTRPIYTNYHILYRKIYHIKCKKEEQQGEAGRGAQSSRERSKERQKKPVKNP